MSRIKSAAQNSLTLPRFEANPSVSSFQSIGSLWAPGYFAQIRDTDPVISPILTEIREHVRSLEWRVEPASDSPAAQIAAEILRTRLDVRMKTADNATITWQDHVASVWDMVSTYGYAFYEVLAEHDNSPLELTPTITPIPPVTVSEIRPDENRLNVRSVIQTVEGGMVNFPAEELIYYVNNNDVPGNFLGISMLRPLLSPFISSQVDTKTYLESRVKNQGLFVAQVTQAMDRGSEEWQMAQRSLNTVGTGDAQLIMLPEWLELQLLTTSKVDSNVDNLEYYDTTKRQALGSFLANLGVGGNTGNRSLADTLKDSENKAWRAKLIQLERWMQTGLVEWWCVQLGIREEDTPRVHVIETEQVADVDSILERMDKLEKVRAALSEDEFEIIKSNILSSILPKETTEESL